MFYARMKTLFFIFLIIFPGPFFFIAAAVGKPGFPGISTFLVYFLLASQNHEALPK